MRTFESKTYNQLRWNNKNASIFHPFIPVTWYPVYLVGTVP